MRLFIAIPLNDEIITALEAVQQQFKQQGIHARYVRTENLHLTLAFIGQTNAVNEVEDALRQFAATWFTEPIEIAISDFGIFRGHRGNTIWVGVADNSDLKLLAKRLQERLRDIGFDIEERKYRPHITLARNARPMGDIWIEVPQRHMLAKTISLFRSDIDDGRRVYTELSSYPLTAC